MAADGTISDGAIAAAANGLAGCVAAGAKDAAADGWPLAEAAAGEPAVVADAARRPAEYAVAVGAVDGLRGRGDGSRGWCLTYGYHWPRTTISPRSVWPTGCASKVAAGCEGS